MCKYSFVMPFKDREKFLKQSIDSIISQTEKEWELILVDDHSTDNSRKIINNYLKDKRIKFYNLDLGTGVAFARDFAIKKAGGDVILIADSDDVSIKERLELTKNIFENNKIDIVYGKIKVIKEYTNTVRPTQSFDLELLKKINYIANPTCAFLKKAYQNTGGYDFKLLTSEDYDLWLNFALNNKKFYFLDKVLVHQYIHKESTTLTSKYTLRKENLNYIRNKYHFPIPDYQQTVKLVKNRDLIDLLSTEGAKNFWFNSQ